MDSDDGFAPPPPPAGGGLGFSSWLSAAPGPQSFEEYFSCYPVVMMRGNERENVSYGGKVILPPSALDKLTRLNIMYPMLFTLKNEPAGHHTNAGVLEFTAEEGRAYLPQWMMQTLKLEPGDIAKVNSTQLPLGKFVKIEPQSVDFLDISDPRAVLENSLRNFSTLTEGDIITISYNDKQYGIRVLETRPSGRGISIVETDLEVDFAPPVGYVEPTAGRPTGPSMASELNLPDPTATATASSASVGDPNWQAFQGGGNRLNARGTSSKKAGKQPEFPVPAAASEAASPVMAVPNDGGPAPLNLPFGQLFFDFKVAAAPGPGTAEQSGFAGPGNTLKAKRPKA
ncbi:ubiquitin fusion degradation protein [Tieghemiomyces parasiticus]|uniref:Ubiquitin fusion degradation protein 1 n=1 Tax=Tieghemiomyces parasiticus TaxID=78921 RepID=A0A9W8DYS4_9FUNG|nr:ubiquitin fusion degradation protein [Tieghemiomyces parasiticus]